VSARPAEHVAGVEDLLALLATNSEGAMRGLDFDIALTLRTGRESKRTLRSINDDAASALVFGLQRHWLDEGPDSEHLTRPAPRTCGPPLRQAGGVEVSAGEEVPHFGH
jgi:hypothetical protein